MNCSRTIRQVVGVRNSTRSSINIRVEDFVCRRIYVHVLYERCDLFLFVLFFWKGPSLNKKKHAVSFGGAVFIRVSSDSFHSACAASLLLSVVVVVVEGYKRKKKVKFWCFNHTIKKKELLQGLCRRRSRTVNSTWGVAGSVQLLVPFSAV